MDPKFKLPKIQITPAPSRINPVTVENTDDAKKNSALSKKPMAETLWRRASETFVLPLLDVTKKRKTNSGGKKQKIEADDKKARKADFRKTTRSSSEADVGVVKKLFVRNKCTLHLYAFQKDLLNKFRLAVRIAIFCSRKFKEHCLRYALYFYSFMSQVYTYETPAKHKTVSKC